MVDVTDASTVKRLASKAVERFGTVDYVVNVAGYQHRSLMKDCKEKEWKRTVNVNCSGVLNVFGAFLPAMVANQSGHILMVSSNAANSFIPQLTLYGASKQFADSLTKGTQEELLEYGVRVTTVQAGCDNTNETDTSSSVVGSDSTGEEFTELNPADVADAVLYAAAAAHVVKNVQVGSSSGSGSVSE